MPVRSIIDIDVNDEKFKDFLELYDRYEEALKKLPGHWEKAGEATGLTAEHIGQMTSALMAQQDLMAQQSRQFREQEKAAQKLRKQVDLVTKPFRDLNKNSKELLKNVTATTRSLLGWVSLGSLLGGALGLWGIGSMAERVSDLRRSSMGLGVSAGEQQAYGLTFGRYVDAQQNLQNIANAQNDLSKRWAFAAMGVNPNGKNAAQLGAEMALRAKEIWDRGNGTLQYAQAHGLTEFYSLADLRRLHGTSLAELRRASTAYSLDRNQLGLSPETLRKWQDFTQVMGEAKARIFRTFVEGLLPLEKPLEGLVTAVSKALQEFLANPHLAQDIESFGQGVKELANYLSSEQFRSDLREFGDDVHVLVQKLSAALHALGLLPSAPPRWSPGSRPTVPSGAMDPRYDQRRAATRDWNPLHWLKGVPPGALTAPFGYGIRSTRLKDREAAAMAYFESQGWTHAQAAGLVARLEKESNLLANPPGWNDGGSAYGMNQWHRDRQEEFRRWAGHDIRKSTPEEQLRFVQYELTKGLEKAAGAALHRARTAQEAGAVVSSQYTRPRDREGEARRTGALAAHLAVTVNNNTGGNANVQANQAAAQQ